MIKQEQESIPVLLSKTIKNVYHPAGMTVTVPPMREGGRAGNPYQACRLSLDHHKIVYREAKTTPVKVGQFVTILKRHDNKNMPLDVKDEVDFLVIHSSNRTQEGQFIFDKKTLIEMGVMSNVGSKGKMAMRVYPPWSKPIAAEAVHTQQWQCRYFLNFTLTGTTTPALVRKHFQLPSTW